MPAPATPFEALQDLAYIIKNFECEIDPKTVIAPSSGKIDARYMKGFSLLIDGKCKNENDFAISLGFIDNKEKNYRRYRVEMLNRMFKIQFFINNNNYDPLNYSNNLLRAYRLWAQSKSARINSGNSAFQYGALECLIIAKKFEIPAVCVEILRDMLFVSSNRPELFKDFHLWKTELMYYLDALNVEVKTMSIRADFMSKCIGKKGLNKDLMSLADLAAEQTEKYIENYPHFQTQYYARLMQVSKYEVRQEWKAMADKAQEAIDYFKQKPYNVTGVLSSFSVYVMVGYSMNEQFVEAKKISEKYLVYAREGSLQWFKNRELLCFNALWAADYDEAYDLVKTALRHERFKHLIAIDQETWRLYQGYLLWLFKLGKLDLGEKEQAEMKRMRASAIFNDMPIYSKDKQGGNIPVLVLQTLFLLIEGKWDEFESRAEALRKYRERNLSEGEDETRSDVFIKMIGLVSKLNNDLADLKDKVVPLIAQLNNPQTPMLGPSFEVEPIKYTRVWNYALEVLESGEFVQ